MFHHLLGRRNTSNNNQEQKRRRIEGENLTGSESVEEAPEVINADISIALNNSVRYGTHEETHRLLQLVKDVNVENLHPVLHVACERFNADVVEKILEKNVDVNVKDMDGCTALHKLAKITLLGRGSSYRIKMISRETIALKLLLKGADVNNCNALGETPLHCASETQNVCMVKLLLNNGADPDIKNNNGDTALHVVIKNTVNFLADSEEIVRMFLENGASVDAKDKDGRTALHYIVDTDDVIFRTIFTELLIWGGSLFTPDENGECLLNKLIYSDNLEVYIKLQKALVEYIIALQCANLDCSEYAVVESKLKFENFISPNLAKHQLEKMKKIKCGSHKMYDVFGSYRDPLFVLDKNLECAVKKASFQLDIMDYGSLLKAKFLSAQKRYKMMLEAHDKVTYELPNEVVWKILTFLKDEDLEVLVKAVSG